MTKNKIKKTSQKTIKSTFTKNKNAIADGSIRSKPSNSKLGNSKLGNSKLSNSISGKLDDKSNFNQSKIEIYQNPDNKTEIKVHFDNETFWLSLNQIAELFGRDKSVISRHLKNIFAEGEIEKKQVVAFSATTASDAKIYQVEYFNLDAIISVGYRVNSKQGTRFRIWATQRLKDYFVKGFAINENRIKEYQENLIELQKTIKLIQNSVDLKSLSSHESKGFLSIITNYAHSFILLRIKFAYANLA